MSGSHSWHAERAAMAMREISEALAGNQMTRNDLIDQLGYTRPRMAHYIRRMHSEGVIHIVNWRKQAHGHGLFMAVFALGQGKDVPKPKPKTAAEVSRDVRKKIKADPARRVDYLQKQRARETRRGRKIVKPDPIVSMFAGLFGQRQAA